MNDNPKYDVDPLLNEISEISYARGLNRQHLADMMGISRHKLGDYLRGMYRPRIDVVRAWLDCLSYTLIPVPRKFESRVRMFIAELDNDK